ncbi:hypothetical protein COB52_01465 [Candidatus Kaiserbacteria bacterium]|nr:MAG: hypothetical protein COB52_01465 [Candidatus Kaiserbacteria bacterium]
MIYDNYAFYAPQRAAYAQAMADYAKYEAQQIALQAKYAADTKGGKTPKETWDLFVSALERGDTDEAASYFIPEKREEMKDNFKIGRTSGAVESFLNEDIKLIKGGTMYPDGDRFEYYTGSIDGGPGYVYMLIKNPITGIWKIEDL